VHNPCNAGREAACRWEKLVVSNARRNFPVATHVHVPTLAFGNRGISDRDVSCVFCYGSGTVIDMEWYRKLFTEAERNRVVESKTGEHQFGSVGIVSRRPSPVTVKGDGFQATQLALDSKPWDLELGVRIWKQFGVEAYDMVANLKTVFSSYGNVITTEAERIAMLQDGSRRLVHQVKSDVDV
jgi:hypothetical protein